MFMPLIDECFNHEAAVLRGEPWQPKTRQNASNFFSQTIERVQAAGRHCSLDIAQAQVVVPSCRSGVSDSGGYVAASSRRPCLGMSIPTWTHRAL